MHHKEEKILIRFANRCDLEEDQLDQLCHLINRVYSEAESGMWQPGAERVNRATVQSLINKNELLIAEINNKTVGCVKINLFDKNIAEFGMLVADPNYRGIGIGRELVKAAEEWAIEQKCSVMRLELLTPKNWKQPSKEFLKSWYARIGYVAQGTEPLALLFPELVDQLATPCDFTVYHKKLSK